MPITGVPLVGISQQYLEFLIAQYYNSKKVGPMALFFEKDIKGLAEYIFDECICDDEEEEEEEDYDDE